MTMKDFTRLVQEKGQYSSIEEARGAIDSFTEAIKEVIKNKDSIAVKNFGTFDTVVRKGREGKIPGSGKTYKTEDKIVPRFKAGKNFKDICA